MRWLPFALLVGCYDPRIEPGAPCSSAGTCPSSLVCVDEVCVEPGTLAIDSSVVDDAAPPPPDGCVSFSTQVDTCSLPAGEALILDGSYTYNTDTHELRDSRGSPIPITHVRVDGLAGPIELVVTTTFRTTAGTTLRATGSVPFGILALDKLELAGRIDVSNGGAGARTSECASAAGQSTTAIHVEGPGGGGGGAFHGKGGRGGTGDVNGIPQSGSLGGVPVALPAGPLGGCPGGAGGTGVGPGGAAGPGGGAVYLVAGGLVHVAGGVHAGGGGGAGGKTFAGSGGGGGAGGMIWIEAPTVRIDGTLAANGGGGGGGADDDNNNGTPGEPGRLASTDAQGGAGGAVGGGAGGDGSQLTLPDGDSAPNDATNAGGGGGGGAGFIVLRGTLMVTGVVSPPRS